ncbi:MAG TPA: hypothetical protein VFT74_07950, partial [Isosphaeraceae bacterium]|nr:hypothetical protein [Isosphaeraceae bacterium]
MAKATGNDIDDVRRQMAQIRRELHEDMQMVVAGAESASDWRYYVRRYPWVALGLAAAAGYFLVPRKKPTSHRIAEETAEDLESFFRKRPRTPPADSEAKAEVKAEKKEKKAGLIGMVFGMVSPIVLRAAQSYAAGYVENWIA